MMYIYIDTAYTVIYFSAIIKFGKTNPLHAIVDFEGLNIHVNHN